MPNLTLTFNNPFPVTLQVGDEAWFLDVDTGQEIKLGTVTDITDLILTIDIVTGASLPETGVDFVFFKKDTRAHVGQLKGYYAEAQFRNNTTAYAELFSVGSEVFESSK
jgi:hypothetical protein